MSVRILVFGSVFPFLVLSAAEPSASVGIGRLKKEGETTWTTISELEEPNPASAHYAEKGRNTSKAFEPEMADGIARNNESEMPGDRYEPETGAHLEKAAGIAEIGAAAIPAGTLELIKPLPAFTPDSSKSYTSPNQSEATNMIAGPTGATADTRLAVLERLLTARHEREIDLYRETNRLVSFMGFGLALIGIIALIAAALLHQRRVLALYPGPSESLAETGSRPSHPDRSAIASASADRNVPGIKRVAASGERFQGQMTSLEERLNELEHLAEHGSTGAANLEYDSDAAESETTHLHQPAKGSTSTRTIPRAAILSRKAETLMHMGLFFEALDGLEEAEHFEPDLPEVHLVRGKVLEKLGRLADAVEAYETAESLDAGNAEALLLKAGVLNRQERHEEALACYERALAKHASSK